MFLNCNAFWLLLLVLSNVFIAKSGYADCMENGERNPIKLKLNWNELQRQPDYVTGKLKDKNYKK